MALPHEGTNGAAPNGTPEKRLTFVLRLFRLKPGMTAYIRPLVGSVPGCFTHYVFKKSRYCSGEDCPHPHNKVETVWKGYLPILLYLPAEKVWKPEAFEVSENLEVDFRHVLQPGQTWEIWRYPEVKGVPSPYQGKLLDDPIPAGLPRAFDVMPVVNAIYHRYDVVLDKKNPRPDRVYLSSIAGEPPGVLAKSNMEKSDFERNDFSFVETAKRMAEEKKSKREATGK